MVLLGLCFRVGQLELLQALNKCGFLFVGASIKPVMFLISASS
jgi:hypothetical protein